MNLSGISRKVQILGSGSMARLCACHGVADDGDVPFLEFPDVFPLVGNCIIYMSPTEILPHISTELYYAFWYGSVKVVGAKKPEDSLLCACDVGTLTDGERLKVLRLRAGLTIRQAAEAVGICRHTLMNYESGKSIVKPAVYQRLTRLYSVR